MINSVDRCMRDRSATRAVARIGGGWQRRIHPCQPTSFRPEFGPTLRACGSCAALRVLLHASVAAGTLQGVAGARAHLLTGQASLDPKPESRNLKFEIRNLNPETRNPKPETRHPTSDTRNPKFDT